MTPNPPSDWDQRLERVHERDEWTCRNCRRTREDDADLDVFFLTDADDPDHYDETNLLTVCADCLALTRPFEDRSSDDVVDHVEYLSDLLERYRFSETSTRFMELCESASYLVSDIEDDGGDHVETYLQRRRLMRFKAAAARNIAEELRAVVPEMPPTMAEEYREYVDVWLDWIARLEVVIDHYDRIVDVDEHDLTFVVAPDKKSLTEELLARKREWGEVNEEYRETVAELLDLQEPEWQQCPECHDDRCVWFTSDAIECATCGARWEETGWLRRRWEMVEGERVGDKRSLEEWESRTEAQS